MMDGSELYQRDDDKPATVERRIRVYLEQTAPSDRILPQAGACWPKSMVRSRSKQVTEQTDVTPFKKGQ